MKSEQNTENPPSSYPGEIPARVREKILKQDVLLPSFNESEVLKQFIPHFSNIGVFHKSYLHVFYGKIAPLTASVIKVFTNLLPDKLKVAGHIFLESHKGELSAHLLLTFDDA